MKNLVAICIGHSRLINGHREGGAVACDGKTSEWEYNRALGSMILDNLSRARVPAVIVLNYEGTGYGTAQRWLAAHLKELGVTLAVELHFNDSDDSKANGHEWLYWHSSAQSQRLAACLNKEMMIRFPDIRARGIQAKNSTARGSEFLRGTHCPAVICEPFFGSHSGNFSTCTKQLDKLSMAISEGLIEYIDGP